MTVIAFFYLLEKFDILHFHGNFHAGLYMSETQLKLFLL